MAAIDASTLIGLRDRAIVAIMAHHGANLRDMISLDVEDVRDDYVQCWSGGFAPSPTVRSALDAWIAASRIVEGAVFLTLARGKPLWGEMSDSAVRAMVRRHLRAAGIRSRVGMAYMYG